MAVKLAKGQKKKENAGKQIMTSFLEYMCALWAVVFAVAVPVYMKEGYYQIGVAKYNAYAHIVVFGMPILLIFVLLYVIFSVKETGISVQAVGKLKKRLSVTDWLVIAYTAAVLLSFFCSGQMKEAFWGYEGWFMGLFSQLTFVLIYFLFSRFLKDYPFVLTVLCMTAGYAFVVGILHRLLIDVVGTYENLSDYYKTQFLSTLGQASWYSSFVTTVLPIGIFAFWYFKNHILRLVSGIFMFAGFMTLVTQNSDSAYFGFFAAMLVLLHVSVKDARKMQRLCEIAALFFVAPKVMCFLLEKFPNPIMVWDQISAHLLADPKMWIFVGVFLLFATVFYVLAIKDCYPVRMMTVLRNIFYVLVLLLIGAWVLILVGGVKGWLPEPLVAFSTKLSYLRWSNMWGNGRGFTWAFTVQMFEEMGLKNQLIGVGPDCYAIFAHGNYAELLKQQWGGAILANAHNEWMNAFVNLGILGGSLYLGVFVSAMVRFVKESGKRPVLLGFAACIAAYMAHNLFCYQQVLCTPFVFLFMALGEYQIRKKEE